MSEERSGSMPDAFDRALGQLQGIAHLTHTRPVTLREVPIMGVGGSTLYVVQSYRQLGDWIDEEAGKRAPARYMIFLEIVEPDGQGGTRAHRHVLPNEVCSLIARQRDTLTAQAGKRAARQAATTRKARGIVPNIEAMRAGRRKAASKK